MTRFIHDQFAKDYLEELLKPYGEVKASSRVAGEVREIDVLFSPVQEANNIEESDDRELIMRLAPLYQQDKEQAVLEGEQRLIIRQLNHRFGEIDSSVIERIRGLSTDQLETLGEAFLDFSSLTDLETWLDQNL